MDIAEIAARTSLPKRRLRYVFDHRVLPSTRGSGEGRGIPRNFTPFEAFGIALAALLLESGLKRGLVTACLYESSWRFGRETTIDNKPLYQGFAARSSWLEVGDGSYLRLHGEGQRGVSRSFDTGWQPLQTGGEVPMPYEPFVLVKIDLAALRRRVGD